MIRCQHCHTQAQLYLCESCTTQLANMLHRLPELLDDLDDRIQKLDRIPHGTIGRNRRPPNQLDIIDFDAAETARKIRRTLHQWCQNVAERHTGRQIPALATVTTRELARWLYVNTEPIARLNCAGQLYHDIRKLVGSGGSNHEGQLIKAIDRHEKHFAGTCPTITGHHGNEPIECGHILYAEVDDPEITCPDCEQTINVERNRNRAAKDRDLQTKQDLLEILTNIDEPVTPTQLDRWITAKRLRIRGYLHNAEMTRFRINEHSTPLYSVSRARKLRRRDQQLQEAKAQ